MKTLLVITTVAALIGTSAAHAQQLKEGQLPSRTGGGTVLPLNESQVAWGYYNANQPIPYTGNVSRPPVVRFVYGNSVGPVTIVPNGQGVYGTNLGYYGNLVQGPAASVVNTRTGVVTKVPRN